MDATRGASLLIPALVCASCLERAERDARGPEDAVVAPDEDDAVW